MSFETYLKKKKPAATSIVETNSDGETGMIEKKLDILIEEIRGLRSDIKNKMTIKTESYKSEQPSVNIQKNACLEPVVLKPMVNEMDLSRIGQI
jgi:hypothetical protein